MTHLSLSLLGPFQAEMADQSLTRFDSDKTRALLAYLSVEAARPHRRETLAGLLWPDKVEQRARQSLSQALTNLRHLLSERKAAPPFLLTTYQTVQFNRDSDYQLDVQALIDALAAVNDHQHTDLETCERCLERLKKSVATYRGEFLAGFSIPDSPAFEEWLVVERERLHRMVIAALDRLVKAYARSQAYDQALPYAWQAVGLDPWREEAQRRLMRLLAQSGRRSEALAQYETCRQLLQEELGAEPTPETQRLYEQIRRGHLGQAAQTQQKLSIPAHNLPPQLTPFVGREVDQREVGHRLADQTCRLLTLVGPGGCGKTRLALQTAQSLLTQAGKQIPFADGIYLVSLVSLRSADHIAAAIAQALNFTANDGLKFEEQLFDYLSEKDLLLILDNFEHLLPGVSLLTELLIAAPQLKILVTSRERLNVREEWLYPLNGLAYPLPDDRLAHLPATEANLEYYSALHLFRQCARQVRPDFSLLEEAAAVAEVCHLVDGLPLGIELAAAWLRFFPCTKIIQEIKHSLDFLSTTQHDVPARHRSMRAVLASSWQLLADDEREVLERLAVFQGTFSQVAAQTIAETSFSTLIALAEKSLVQTTVAGAYQLHELIRQFAWEQLSAVPDTQKVVQDRHAKYYLAFLQHREAALISSDQQSALAEIAENIEDIWTAWHWAVQHHQRDRLAGALDSLGRFYEWQGRYRLGEAACRDAVAALSNYTAPNSRPFLAKLLTWQSSFNRNLGRFELAQQLQSKSLALLDEAAQAGQDVQAETAFALLQMGRITYVSDQTEAQQLFAKSLRLYQVIGDRWQEAEVYYELGNAVSRTGVYQEARQLLETSLTLRRQLGDQRGIAVTLLHLGYLAHIFQENLSEGETLARQGLAVCRKIGDQANIAVGLRSVGVVIMWRGKFAEAESAMQTALAIFRDLGKQESVASVYTLLGFIRLYSGRYGTARQQLELGLTQARQIGSQFNIGLALFLLGHVALAEEALAEAERVLTESLTVFETLGEIDAAASARALLGCIALKQGQPATARAYLTESIRFGIDARRIRTIITLLPVLALLLVEQGQIEQAVELYALLTRHELGEHSPWFEDVAGKQITAAAETLPPAVVSAAQARGRGRDMWTTMEAFAKQPE